MSDIRLYYIYKGEASIKDLNFCGHKCLISKTHPVNWMTIPATIFLTCEFHKTELHPVNFCTRRSVQNTL